MTYIYKDFTFNTSSQFYRIIAADINSAYIKDCQGVCQIYYPRSLGGVSRIMTEFHQIIIELGSHKYRLKSLDPISFTIIQIDDLHDTVVDTSDDRISILSDHITEDLIYQTLTAQLFDEVGSTGVNYHYTEFINYLVNRSVNLNLIDESTPINFEDTKDRYLIDATHSMYALYDRFAPYLKKYGFYLKNINETEETGTREVATLQFDDYNKDYMRLYPNWNNEMTSYRVHCKLILNTSSVSKFERLLNEYHSIKFLSNIVRIYLEDSLKRIWTANIKWDTDVDTNSPTKAENDRSEVSYMLGFGFEYEFQVARNNKYAPIKLILLNIKNSLK